MRRIALFGLVLFAATAAAAAASSGGLPNIGSPSTKTQPVHKGYYDHHIDAYLITDASSKSQAKAMHINYSAELQAVKGIPDQYFVHGHAAKGQLTIFGSEPGEADYNPLWEEVWGTWKAGVKPVLLGRDDQINSLVKKGKLTMKDAHILLNAPIPKVGKSGWSSPERPKRRASPPLPNSAAELLPSAPSGSQDDHPAGRSRRASPFWGICRETAVNALVRRIATRGRVPDAA